MARLHPAMGSAARAQLRLTYAGLRDLADAMVRPPWLLTTAQVWQCYRRLNAGAVGDPSGFVTDLVALVRYALGASARLDPVSADVAQRFNLWLGREGRAGRTYTEVQLLWLRLLRDHVAANAEASVADVRDAPAFTSRGGLRAARAALGEDRLVPLLEELSDTLMPSGQEAA